MRIMYYDYIVNISFKDGTEDHMSVKTQRRISFSSVLRKVEHEMTKDEKEHISSVSICQPTINDTQV